MPPTRRKPSGTAARAQQTLAFGPNPNKVTKPSQPAAGNKKKKPSPPAPTDAERLQKAAADISTPSPGPEEEDYPPRPEAQLESPRALAIRGQGGGAAADVGVGKSEAEEKGGRVSDAQVRRYWKGKEEERIAPRVHQAGLSVNEKILRHFDLSSQYGPCIGIPRMRRWKRAETLGLGPPVEVLGVLVKEERSGNGKAERAFMEGLLTSRLAVNE
ncbi:hypothetical protein HO133_007155 [Letharia lupina]|uniref:DNA polymerase delta subunit 4 n=1 Tax=Letharia lupina TaxID=560253 RepID=A0A8H6FIB7_9LECA|nr:uncharacterized protein HO133_007155 [Letharia lupina]KAF6229041.1 hypothetical protein HO133_007155 [Letharia lupina]